MTLVGDKPGAPLPRIASRASEKEDVETPFRYSVGISVSILGERRAYLGRAEFKRESVRLADTSGKTDRQIERDLGLYQGAILRWRDELEADPIDAFPGTGHQKPLEEEVRRLLRELDIAREERDILKKVVAIFSKTPKADSGS